MDKFFDVLVVGELNVDLILDGIEKFPEIGKEVLAKKHCAHLCTSSRNLRQIAHEIDEIIAGEGFLEEASGSCREALVDCFLRSER